MKILYGVPGEGMGHATRAKVLLDHLVKNHDVRIVASDRAYTFLASHFGKRVYEIKGFHIGFRDGSVSRRETVRINLKEGPKTLERNFSKYLELHKTFAPDLVISDFESFSYLFAKTHKLPVISIDNMQVMDRGKLDIKIPKQEKPSYELARNIVRAKVPQCNHYLISTFFDVVMQKKHSSVVPPIIRQEILNATTVEKEHILVYQSSYGKNGVLDILNQLDREQFVLYGFNKEETHGNVHMKKFSEAGFIDDFASAKAVIANGGYSFISEAVFLKKPICSIPIDGQFEQYMNAAYVEKMGYGKLLTHFDADKVKAFLYDREVYKKNLQTVKITDNSVLFQTLERLIDELTR